MAPSEDSEKPSSSDNERSGSDDDGDGEVVDVPRAVVVDVLEPLAGSSTDVPPPAVVVDALEPLDDDGSEKVLGLLQRAKARKRLEPAVKFLAVFILSLMQAMFMMEICLASVGT